MPREFTSRDVSALLDISQAARSIQEFMSDVNHERFLNDRKTQSAVIHQLLILGEAAKRVSPECRASLPRLAWSQMTGMRDHLIHAYDAVDFEEVWRTATGDVAGLHEVLQVVLRDVGDAGHGPRP